MFSGCPFVCACVHADVLAYVCVIVYVPGWKHSLTGLPLTFISFMIHYYSIRKESRVQTVKLSV